jgi:hypothetical protein
MRVTSAQGALVISGLTRCRAELHAPFGRGQKKAALFFAFVINPKLIIRE